MQQKSGFTLIEMIVVVSILSILSILAVPSFLQFVAERKLDTAVKEISFYVAEARTQAIVSHQTTVLCLDHSISREVCSNYLPSTNRLDRTFILNLPQGITLDRNEPLYFFANGSLKEGIHKITLTNQDKMRCIAIGILGSFSHSTGGCE